MAMAKKYKARVQCIRTGEIHEETFQQWLHKDGTEVAPVEVVVHDHFYTKLNKEPFVILDIDEITDFEYSNLRET